MSYICPDGHTPLILLDISTQFYRYLKRVLAYPVNHRKDLCLYLLSKIPFEIHPSISQARLVILFDERDSKGNYWRDDFIAKNLGSDFPKYKGHRPDKTEDLLMVKDLLSSVARESFPSYSLAGFEADDLIAYFRRLKEQYYDDRDTFTVTVDYDHLQLVDDELRFFFYTTMPQKKFSALKTEEDLPVLFAEKCNKKVVDIPSFIDYKCRLGDRSDNLPRNTPRELVDLLHQNILLPNTLRKEFLGHIRNLEPNTTKGYTEKLELDLYL